ncbi:hypothetical protein, partial [Aeromonas salmonicida]|uniref:hypothetical protein n=1 Tax=Aeromonas salmonicida TaxID=645 RepID=UPI001A8F8561
MHQGSCPHGCTSRKIENNAQMTWRDRSSVLAVPANFVHLSRVIEHLKNFTREILQMRQICHLGRTTAGFVVFGLWLYQLHELGVS